MFCNSCGGSNPVDAKFCGSCGKPIVPAPIAQTSEAPKLEAAKITPVTSSAEAAKTPIPARASATKKRRVGWGWIAAACIVLAIFLYPLRSGGGVCDAARDEVVQQVPPAVEILAARYPLQIGLLRSAFNDRGAVDRVAQDYVRASMQENQQEPGGLSCYLSYYVVMFNRDRVRTSIADWMEKRLQLK